MFHLLHLLEEQMVYDKDVQGKKPASRESFTLPLSGERPGLGSFPADKWLHSFFCVCVGKKKGGELPEY